MSKTRKIVISLVVVGILGLAAVVSLTRSQERGVEVRVEEVGTRELVATITATGSVRARRQVNISSDISGRVVQLNVDEGDAVERGQVLLRIDRSQTEAAVARARAALAQAEAQVAQQRSNLIQAHRDSDRLRDLMARDPDMASRQSMDDAETRVEVQRSLLQAAEHGVAQARAALEETEDQLAKTTIAAPISGLVTRLNIEEGETVVIGTMNNPGSLLLTISDLAVVEAVLSVDETDIPHISVGDSAVVELDALPGRQFAARVEKIGNSAIRPTGSPSPGAQTSTDFEVILTLLDPPSELRPDLSAVADIIVNRRADAVAVPIISVTVRDRENGAIARDTATSPGGPLSRRTTPGRQEGVFVLQDGRAVWRPIELGITGQEYFEILSGVEPGESVVAGPFQRIQDLRDGDAVRVQGTPRRD
jgi:HlyD family secretion protein